MILFVKLSDSSFIQLDEKILQEQFRVKTFFFGKIKGFSFLLRTIQLKFWLLRNIFSSKIIYLWFADYYALLPLLFAKMFHRKSVLIIGGYDAMKVHEYSYGAHNKRTSSIVVKLCCRLASKILVVSDFTFQNLKQNTGLKFDHKTEILYNGVDTQFFQYTSKIAKEKLVLTVCGYQKISSAYIKGMDHFIELAKLMKDYKFIVIGLSGEALKFFSDKTPPNLEFIEKLPAEKLKTYYQRSMFIAQLSRVESFGMALSEGMSCECIPVTFSGTATSEIVDQECGLIIPKGNVEQAQISMEWAAENFEKFGSNARKKIQTHFSMEIRKKKLVEIISHFQI